MTHNKGETRRAMTTLLPVAILLLLAIAPTPARATTQTFNFTGAQQNFVVPAGVTQLTIEAFGAQAGAGGNGGGAGANGGSVTATFTVTPGETLAIFVGGQGGAGGAAGGTAGFNGGGVGGSGEQGGGGGGGASDVRQGGTALANRIVVAGAGGGGGASGFGAGGAGSRVPVAASAAGSAVVEVAAGRRLPAAQVVLLARAEAQPQEQMAPPAVAGLARHTRDPARAAVEAVPAISAVAAADLTSPAKVAVAVVGPRSRPAARRA